MLSHRVKTDTAKRNTETLLHTTREVGLKVSVEKTKCPVIMLRLYHVIADPSGRAVKA
jgi:hypothetical protein